MKEKKLPLPEIADIIVKVRQKEPLTAEEKVLYLMHIRGFKEEAEKKVVSDGNKKNGNK